jgi:Ala-tRNA(Pro) deacylase
MTELCAARVREYLMTHGIGYEIHEHAAAYTAQELAAAEHVPGRQVAKVVMLRVGDDLAMAVLRAPDHVSIGKARIVFGREDVRIASELDFQETFPDCELGTAPPFGHLYGLLTYVDERLLEANDIICAAGSHTTSMQLATDDWYKLVEPITVDIAAG